MQNFDIFQYKRYKNPLAPSEYMSEFGNSDIDRTGYISN